MANLASFCLYSEERQTKEKSFDKVENDPLNPFLKSYVLSSPLLSSPLFSSQTTIDKLFKRLSLLMVLMMITMKMEMLKMKIETMQMMINDCLACHDHQNICHKICRSYT
eukprot:749457-Hanusia_phi.AAC.1